MKDLISSIMTKNVVTIDSTEALNTAREIFTEHHVRHLPVIDNNKLVGILSLTDLMRMSFGDSYYKEEKEIDKVLGLNVWVACA